MAKLGFKLAVRKYKNLIAKNAYSAIKNLSGAIALFLSILGVILAVNGNKLSKASYELSKNDTAQQAQIASLHEILSTQKTQVDTLIAIVNELRQINANSLDNNSQINQQTRLISTNAQPTFKIVEFNSNLNEKNNCDVNLYIKNVGLRTAFNLTCSSIFLKYEGNRIISHELLNNTTVVDAPINLFPSDESSYLFRSALILKQTDIDNSITAFRFIYYDKALNKTDTTAFFLKNIQYSSSYENIGGLLKVNIQRYLTAKNLL